MQECEGVRGVSGIRATPYAAVYLDGSQSVVVTQREPGDRDRDTEGDKDKLW